MITMKIPALVNELDILLPAVTINSKFRGDTQPHSASYFKLELLGAGDGFRLHCPIPDDCGNTIQFVAKTLPFRNVDCIMAVFNNYAEDVYVNHRSSVLSTQRVMLPCVNIMVHVDDEGYAIITIDE